MRNEVKHCVNDEDYEKDCDFIQRTPPKLKENNFALLTTERFGKKVDLAGS
jgi:hypothetical protein